MQNHIQKLDLVCGLKLDSNQSYHVFQVLDHATPVLASDIDKLEINSLSLVDRYTSKGCFYLKANETGTLIVKRKSGPLGYIAAEAPQSETVIEKLNLEKFEPLTAQPSLQSQIYEEFCSAKSRIVYSRDAMRRFHLNFSPFGRLPGIRIKAQVTDQNGNLTRVNLLDRAFALSPSDGSLPIVLKFEVTDKQPATFEAKLEISDFFGQIFETPTCTFVVSSSSPKLLEVGGSSFYSGQYIDLENTASLEFKIESPVPIRFMTLRYQGSEEESIEQYVPFKVGPGQWSAIAPLPKLSGPKIIKIGIESEGATFSEEQVSVDFGENIYYGNPAKIVVQSRNKNYFLVVIRDSLALFNASNQKFFDFKGRGEILNAEISPDGRYVLAIYSDQSVIVDRETGSQRIIGGSLQMPRFSNDGQELFAVDQERTLVWVDVKTGAYVTRLQVNNDIIRHTAIDPKEANLVVSTDRRHFYRIDLATKKNPEFLSECPTGSADRLIISNKGDKIVYNCSEVTYLKSLDPGLPAVEIFRFKSGDGIRALGFSPDDVHIAIGGGLGEWAVYQPEDRSVFPDDQIFALKNKLYFDAAIVDMIFSEDGRFIMVGSDDGQTLIMSTANKQVIDRRMMNGIILRGFVESKMSYFMASQTEDMHFYRLPALTHEFEVGLPVNTIALSKHGLMAVSTLSPKNAASTQEAKALIFDLKSYGIIRSVIHDRTINSAEISPDGQWLLTASEDSKAKISRIHAEDTLDLSVLFDDPMRPVRKAFYSHSGSRVGIVVHEKIFLVDASTGKMLKTFQANDWYPSAEFSKDDKYIVAAGSDMTAKIYESETGQVKAVSKAAGWVWNAKLSPNGQYLAALSWDNKLRVGETVRSEDGGIEGLRDFMELDLALSGEYLEFSPDSKYLSFSLWGGDSFFLDMSSRNLRKLPCVQKGFSSAPVFSDDSQLMAVGHNSMAYLYKIPELKPVQAIAHAERVTSLGFLNDQFFSGSWDGRVKSTPINLTNKASCVFVSR
jgi:WD40 repeat protein